MRPRRERRPTVVDRLDLAELKALLEKRPDPLFHQATIWLAGKPHVSLKDGQERRIYDEGALIATIKMANAVPALLARLEDLEKIVRRNGESKEAGRVDIAE
jgi:hypothetical protein